MKTKILSLVLFVLAGLNVSGQQTNRGTNEGILNLRFLDDKTGMVVIPNYIDLRQQDDSKKHNIIKMDSTSQDGAPLIKPNGKLLLKLPKATYDIVVHTRGYKPMATDLLVTGNSEGEIIFYLVPLALPKECTPEYYNPLKKQYAMLMHGFIMDDSTGKPLEDVLIYSADKVAQGRTDNRGYFEFDLPLPATDAEIESRGTIFFEKGGYVTEVRANFDMGPKMTGPYPSRMTPGSGITRRDDFKGSENNREPSRMTIEDVKKMEDTNKRTHDRE